MRIKQRPTHSGEQRTPTNTARIMANICDDPGIRDDLRSITAEFGACYFCESFESYRFVHVEKDSHAAAQRRKGNPNVASLRRCVRNII
jgi:hypothetical protein